MLHQTFRIPSAPAPQIVEGIYCDYFNTLKGPGDFVDHELVAYLNACHLAGTKVVIFSTCPEDAAGSIAKLGLHPDIAKVERKLNYYHRMLQTVIDDCPKISLKAQTMFDPKSAVFRAIVRDTLRNAPPADTSSPSP